MNVLPADEMAGLKVVRLLDEAEARTFLAEVIAGKYSHYVIHNAQAQDDEKPIYIVSAETKRNAAAVVVWFSGCLAEPLKILRAEELRAAG